ncbi:MAG TPA: hypothetical protein VL326_01725 [Kofleriaceae bacterium]|nr:hypothetical protein [Kofleriaceae bacterium]
MKPSHDIDLMALADGEADEREFEELLRDPASRRKVEAVDELGELVRGHLELAADAVPQKKLDALWREIDKGITREAKSAESAESERRPATQGAAAPAGGWSWLRRVGRWFDHYRGHIITGAVSAGAVAALALVLRGPGGDGTIAGTKGGGVEAMPVVHHPAEIESLDTPGGSPTVFNLEDDDGDATVIWVTPDDTVEGI